MVLVDTAPVGPAGSTLPAADRSLVVGILRSLADQERGTAPVGDRLGRDREIPVVRKEQMRHSNQLMALTGEVYVPLEVDMATRDLHPDGLAERRMRAELQKGGRICLTLWILIEGNKRRS